jgi:hypothetical protein
VVGFTPQPLYFQYPLHRQLGGPQSWSDTVTKRKITSPCWELNPNHPAHSLVAILSELLQEYFSAKSNVIMHCQGCNSFMLLRNAAFCLGMLWWPFIPSIFYPKTCEAFYTFSEVNSSQGLLGQVLHVLRWPTVCISIPQQIPILEQKWIICASTSHWWCCRPLFQGVTLVTLTEVVL